MVEKTLNQTVNRDICTMLESQNACPESLFGNRLLRCKPCQAYDDQGESIDLGYVGEITQVTTEPIHKALDQGNIPVLSSIALDQAGQPYNVNADTAAAKVALALKAQRLVYLCDMPGLLRNPNDESTPIPTLHIDEVKGLKTAGTIAEGMSPKVDSAIMALQGGTHRVHFIDGRLPHSLLLEIFTDEGVGTEIIANKRDGSKTEGNEIS